MYYTVLDEASEAMVKDKQDTERGKRCTGNKIIITRGGVGTM